MTPWFLIAAPVVIGVLVLALVAAVAALRPAGAARLLPAVKVGGIIVAVVYGAFTLVAVATTLVAGQLVVSFPVRTLTVMPDAGLEFLEGPDAQLLSGGLDHVTGTVEGLSVPTRLLLASGALMHAAMVVVIAVLVSRLAGSLQRGEAFRAGAGRVAVVSSIAVLVGGGAGSLLTQIGEWRVSAEALDVTAWSYTGTGSADSLEALGWPAPAPFLLTLEWWPLLIAAALAAVGVAFRAGERLQRDTEGLV
jgi:hypothetical protein